MQFAREVIDLNGNWSFCYSLDADARSLRSAIDIANAGLKPLPAIVPGNFELDLQRNGLNDGDPLTGMNIVSFRKFESATFWYYRTFAAAPMAAGNRSILVFEGLDCLADIYVNGTHAGSTDNMLIEHRLDITECVRPGDNEIVVAIRSAFEEAKRFEYPAGLVGRTHTFEGLYIRKAPHMYGWDIMPRALSAGIWRPVRIEIQPEERFVNAYLGTERVDADGQRAQLVLHYKTSTRLAHGDRYEIAIEGACGSSRFAAGRDILFAAGTISFGVDHPKLWYTAGRGDANLYNVSVNLLKNGQVIETARFRHGIRTIDLVRTSTTDAAGSGEFVFKVNGERVFMKGSNWVPVDPYHSRDRERLPRILPMLSDLGCNMIRCWGGNVYEDDYLFDYCDEHGILIWQDFAMACHGYPQDADFQERLATEARGVVRRLRQHASIALWAGDNECDEGRAYWFGLRQDPNGNVLTRKVIPAVLADEDPYRAYLPSSPFVDPEAYAAPTRCTPEDHLWGSRQYYKMDFYRKSICHFASEIGYHGAPSANSIKKFISPEYLWPYTTNPEWILHCSSPIPGINICDYRVELMATQIRNVFGTVPDNLEDYCIASQISQAEAFKFFIELFRSQKWRRTGILWWNLMDGWPQFSDAVVDYYFEKKLAYHYIKRSQADLCLMIADAADGALELVAANDTRTGSQVDFRVTSALDGAIISQGSTVVEADASTRLGGIEKSGPSFYIIEWDADGKRGINHFLAGEPPYDLSEYRRWLSVMTDRLTPS